MVHFCRPVGLGLALASASALLASSTPALAQDANIAVAEALFRDGRTAMAAGDYATACPKFEESNRIDPKLGTLLNLALCHEKSGRSASAWAEYAQAASLAARAGQSDREQVARDRAAALEPTLAHVVIEADTKADEVVKLDDQIIGPAAFGTPIPVDPGAHVLRATAPGSTPFEQSFSVEQGAPAATLKVMALAAASPAPVASGAEASPETSGRSRRRTIGYVVGGVGVVLVGLGGFFGVQAFSEKNDAQHGCGTNFCTAAGLDAKSAMKTDETFSTIGVIAGAVAVGAGVYLVLSNRGEGPGAARVSFDVTGRGVRAAIAW
jgi:hypothetical protein